MMRRADATPCVTPELAQTDPKSNLVVIVQTLEVLVRTAVHRAPSCLSLHQLLWYVVLKRHERYDQPSTKP